MTRLFRITEQGLVESRRKPLDLESRIEDWVAGDLSLVGVDGSVLAGVFSDGFEDGTASRWSTINGD